tara:strand:+ start:75 stop:1118 length:1044 start_codon:yes stop_codon:yes gene_type:complete
MSHIIDNKENISRLNTYKKVYKDKLTSIINLSLDNGNRIIKNQIVKELMTDRLKSEESGSDHSYNEKFETIIDTVSSKNRKLINKELNSLIDDELTSFLNKTLFMIFNIKRIQEQNTESFISNLINTSSYENKSDSEEDQEHDSDKQDNFHRYLERFNLSGVHNSSDNEEEEESNMHEHYKHYEHQEDDENNEEYEYHNSSSEPEEEEHLEEEHLEEAHLEEEHLEEEHLEEEHKEAHEEAHKEEHKEAHEEAHEEAHIVAIEEAHKEEHKEAHEEAHEEAHIVAIEEQQLTNVISNSERKTHLNLLSKDELLTISRTYSLTININKRKKNKTELIDDIISYESKKE